MTRTKIDTSKNEFTQKEIIRLLRTKRTIYLYTKINDDIGMHLPGSKSVLINVLQADIREGYFYQIHASVTDSSIDIG